MKTTSIERKITFDSLARSQYRFALAAPYAEGGTMKKIDIDIDIFNLFIIWLSFILLVFIAMWLDVRVTALELRCDGRCQYGDTACKAHCDKLGHCPMDR